jgi:hypothetical protein
VSGQRRGRADGGVGGKAARRKKGGKGNRGTCDVWGRMAATAAGKAKGRAPCAGRGGKLGWAATWAG